MTIKDMHYDFKKKLNKLDSQQYRNLLIPEIDWTLNEAQELFVKMVAKPRINSYLGFEKSQRSIDDIRTVVKIDNIKCNYDKIKLPLDYWHFLKGNVFINSDVCNKKKARIYIRQHDDNFQNSPFDKSSYKWGIVNGIFVGNYINLYTNDFRTINANINYIKKLNYIHNAEDFRLGVYDLPSGVELKGSVNCELPDHTHREIVDIAVLLVSGEINTPDYRIKLNKLTFNNLK